MKKSEKLADIALSSTVNYQLSIDSISSSSVTVPASPSTASIMPDLIRSVATPVPITAGMPYSRATMEPCANAPPTSVTNPTAWEKSGVQAGVVVVHADGIATQNWSLIAGIARCGIKHGKIERSQFERGTFWYFWLRYKLLTGFS